MSVRALIFDFDGLLLDTERPLYESWRETYASYGVELSVEQWATCIGTADSFDPLDDLERRTGLRLDRPSLQRSRRRRRDALLEHLPACDGAARVLEQAAAMGLGLAVASSSPTEWVDEHLRRLGLRRWFTHLSCFDGVGAPKPAPDVYRRATEALAVEAEACIAFEDSRHGLTAAKAAGLRCVVVPSPMTGHMDFTGADMVVERLGRPPLAHIVAVLGAASS